MTWVMSSQRGCRRDGPLRKDDSISYDRHPETTSTRRQWQILQAAGISSVTLFWRHIADKQKRFGFMDESTQHLTWYLPSEKAFAFIVAEGKVCFVLGPELLAVEHQLEVSSSVDMLNGFPFRRASCSQHLNKVMMVFYPVKMMILLKSAS